MTYCKGSEIPLDGTKSYTPGSPPPLCAGVSVRGVGERTERADPRLPDREQPDPDWAQDHPHGGHGGGVVTLTMMTMEVLERSSSTRT